MSGLETSKAWPTKQYSGKLEDFEEYESDLEGWIITEDYEEFFDQEHPGNIPRVETIHMVANDEESDPNGPPGT